MSVEDGGVKRLRLRYPGTCRSCGTSVDAGVAAVYERASKSVVCLACADGEHHATDVDLATGAAGSSAKREYERRREAREQRVREAHPRIGGFLLAISDEPQSTKAWATGAKGEELLGAALDRLAERGVRVLHDRRIPRTRANIDHIAVSRAGVFVVDAKHYQGRPTLRVEGGLLRPRVEKLMVGARDQTRLVEGTHKQVAHVRGALRGQGMEAVPVQGVLCFVRADWPLIGGSFTIAGVRVLWPRKLGEVLVADGPLAHDAVERAHGVLAAHFPPA